MHARGGARRGFGTGFAQEQGEQRAGSGDRTTPTPNTPIAAPSFSLGTIRYTRVIHTTVDQHQRMAPSC